MADGIESNPGPDHSKHYDRSVLHDTYQERVKFSETVHIYFFFCNMLFIDQKSFFLEIQ